LTIFAIYTSLEVMYTRLMMIRTNIYLSKPQKLALEKKAKRLGITFAEMIRRILDKALEKK
jgi:hypothetical protein